MASRGYRHGRMSESFGEYDRVHDSRRPGSRSAQPISRRNPNYLRSTLIPWLRKSSRLWKSFGVALVGGPTRNMRPGFSTILVLREGKSSNSWIEVNVFLRLSYISNTHFVCTIDSLVINSLQSPLGQAGITLREFVAARLASSSRCCAGNRPLLLTLLRSHMAATGTISERIMELLFK